MARTKKETPATAQATSTAVATSQQFTKDNVPQLIAQLEERRRALTGDESGEKIDLDAQYEGIKISSVTTVGRLLEISASVHARGRQYDEEIARYNLGDKNIAEFKTFDKTVSQWAKIIDKSINKLINKVELEKVEAALENLKEFESEEAKLARRMEEVYKSATSVIQ